MGGKVVPFLIKYEDMKENGTSVGEKTPFQFAVGEKDDVIVVLFSGYMTSNDGALFDQVAAELSAKNQRVVLLSFSEVEHTSPGVLSSFVKFQKALRDRGKLLGLCGVTDEMKLVCQSSGVIRDAELYPNVPTAWRALKLKAQNTPVMAKKPEEDEKKSA